MCSASTGTARPLEAPPLAVDGGADVPRELSLTADAGRTAGGADDRHVTAWRCRGVRAFPGRSPSFDGCHGS